MPSVWCRSEPPSRRQAVTCGNNEVSDESSNEDGGDWPGSEGWHGGCGEMSGGVEIAFYFHVVCASLPSMRGVAPRDKKINRRKTARELAGGLVQDRA